MIMIAVLAVTSMAQFVLDTSLTKNPSGGTYTLTAGPPPPFRNGAYTLTSGTYGVTNMAGGSVTLAGEVTYKFKWTGPPGSTPTKAYLLINSSATWHDGGSGDADNGIGTPYVAVTGTGSVSPSGYSTGSKFDVKDVTDGTFEVKLTPTVHTTGSATVSISVQAINLTMAITGVNETVSASASEALVGQQQTATVAASGGYVLKNKSWSVSGPKTFGKVISGAEHDNTNFPYPSNPTGYETYFDSRKYDLPIVINAPDNVSTTFYEAATGTETVTCTADLYDANSNMQVSGVSISRDVAVIAPEYDITLTPGTSQVYVSGGSVYVGTTGPGMSFSYYCKTPSGFGSSSDHGKLALCQLIKQDVLINPHPPFDHLGFSDYRLDNTFPFRKDHEVDAIYGSGSPRSDSDTPDVSFPTFLSGQSPTSATATDDFYMSVIYRPPGTGEYVPLREKDWTWHATASVSGGLWTVTGNPQVGPGSADFDLDKVSWEHAAINNAIPTLP